MARILSAEAIGAAGLGAAEAAIGARMGPGKISLAVYLEGVGLAAGLFGGMVGARGPIVDGLFYGALALGAKRATGAAMSGKLLQGPAAWGGDGDSYPAIVAGGGEMGGGARITGAYSGARQLGRGGGFNLYPVTQEAPGVAG